MKIHRRTYLFRAYRRMGKQDMQQKLYWDIFSKLSKPSAAAIDRIIENSKLIQAIPLRLNQNLLNSRHLIQVLIQASSAIWCIVGCASWYPAVIGKVRSLPLLLCHIPIWIILGSYDIAKNPVNWAVGGYVQLLTKVLDDWGCMADNRDLEAWIKVDANMQLIVPTQTLSTI